MRRLLALTVPLLLAPVGSASAGWSADHAQSHAGTAFRVSAAGGNGDRVALSWGRRLGTANRAEVRLGRARDGFTQAPRLLDSSSHSVEAPVAAYVRGGSFGVAWRRYEASNQRIRLTTLDRNGRRTALLAATTTGESAYFPVWTGGAVPALSWSRRTRADALELTTMGFRGVRLPVAPLSEPGLATDANGLATVVWVNDDRVLVSDRTATGFGAPFVLATGEGVNRARVVRAAGATLVFWRDGQDLVVAVRPPGGAFGPPRTVLAETTDAPQLVVTGTNEVLAVAPVGDSSLVGAETLVRLGADGAPLGPDQVLGRGRLANLVADGTGSAFVAWISVGAERAVTERRIATGGILGAPMLLAARSEGPGGPALAATREGGAALAWIAGGDVHARTYRP